MSSMDADQQRHEDQHGHQHGATMMAAMASDMGDGREAAEASPAVRVHRIEVRPREGMADALGERALHDVESLGLAEHPDRVECAKVYLIEGQLDAPMLDRVMGELLADPVLEEATAGAGERRGGAMVEVHPLPGVMDPDADAVEAALKGALGVEARVRTGRRYDLFGVDAAAARTIAERAFANPVVHAIHTEPFHPESFPVGHERSMEVHEVPLRGLDDAALERLSREAHLFLSLEEMKAIQAEYERQGREPREIELETLAQTWSEHCVHKTLKATIRYREDGVSGDSAWSAIEAARAGRPGHEVQDDGSIIIRNLLKSTIAAATHELMEDGADWCLSVFVDNAGVIAFDDETAVCFKVETHNHPSAIEPYGGAATGIGGVIRDIIGTGLAAKPIAGTDVFCVGHPDRWARGESESGNAAAGTSETNLKKLPAGCLHPKRILQQVVAGVRDYGNRMGIPTLNGAVWFDDSYVGNPLVYCGSVGVMPRDKVEGDPRPGDRIIAIGGRTGRDGIHGATFSSAELTDTHADEFSHAVQIGNPVTEKKVLDVILQARDWADGCLYSAITDCGAGGFSSAVGEMGERLGATVELERAPLKYAGLTPTEIWISEAQERMVLAVPAEKVETLRRLCERHDVEMCELGEFGTEDRSLVLRYAGEEVGRLDMHFLHEGLPGTMREARWGGGRVEDGEGGEDRSSQAGEAGNEANEDAAARGGGGGGTELRMATADALLGLLAHPNIASKHWIVRQYDHEVQGRSVVGPFAGKRGVGPSDGAVIQPVAGSRKGLAIANGLATGWKDDPYKMTLAAIDECVRNLVCSGADPERIAILDNFCWPSCGKAENLGSLVRAAEGCYDGAMAYRTPFISGKDSLNNQFTTEDGRTIEIPPTLLISGMGIVNDIERCVTMDAKRAGDLLVIVGRTTPAMGGSHYAELYGAPAGCAGLPGVSLEDGPKAARAVAKAIEHGAARAAHDCSEGGLLTAAAEMALAGDVGLRVDLLALPTEGGELPRAAECFAETPGRYLLEVRREDLDALDEALGDVPYAVVGEFVDEPVLTIVGEGGEVAIEDLRQAWRGTLDW